jgi:hypothetical protein
MADSAGYVTWGGGYMHVRPIVRPHHTKHGMLRRFFAIFEATFLCQLSLSDSNMTWKKRNESFFLRIYFNFFYCAGALTCENAVSHVAAMYSAFARPSLQKTLPEVEESKAHSADTTAQEKSATQGTSDIGMRKFQKRPTTEAKETCYRGKTGRVSQNALLAHQIREKPRSSKWRGPNPGFQRNPSPP